MPKPPNLLRKVSIDGKWLMLPVVRHKIKGSELRYDLTRVLHAGVPVVAEAGTFYLEYREAGRRVRRSVGDHPQAVKAALATQASVIDLRARGVVVDDAPELRPRRGDLPGGKRLRTVLDEFTKSPPLTYRRSSFLKYRNAMECFVLWADKNRKRFVEEIGRDDIKAFMTSVVREDKLDVSTARDKAGAVITILKDHGSAIAMRKGDWPRMTERQRAMYKPEVLKKLFAAADEDEYVLFQTFLMSGMREMEVAYLWWPDFRPEESTLSVTKKLGFDPKNYQERTVAVPGLLVELLEAHRERQGGSSLLIFPTTARNRRKGAPGGQADYHLIRILKSLAFRAGLNCGRCTATLRRKKVHCATAPCCREFGLHMFRHTYATTLLRDGVDLLSLQKQLGHKDLDSTRKYLRALEPEDLRAKINGTSLATRFV